MRKCFALALGASLASTPALAQTAAAPAAPPAIQNQDKQSAFLGDLKLGLGFGMVLNLGSIDRVDEAQIVNGVVRVTDDGNNTVRPIFEGHVFWDVNDKVAAGPFVGVQLDEGSVVKALGGGVMTGFRVSKGKQTLNFGVGAFLDPKVRTLGNGIVEDQPLPSGEDQIRYRNRSRLGVLVMTSYGF